MVNSLKMKNTTAIKIFFNGDELHFDISSGATCNDVIKMATRNKLSKLSCRNFAVFKCAFGEQKMLPGRTKLLKHVRGCGQKFTLEVREVDRVKVTKLSRAKLLLRHFFPVLRVEFRDKKSTETYLHDNLVASAVSKDKGFYEKNITVLCKPAEIKEHALSELHGKQELISRYLKDALEHSPSIATACVEINLQVRTRGVFSVNDSGSATELHEGTQGDGEENIDTLSVCEDEHFMDVAFITNKSVVENIPRDAESMLNQCMICDNDETNAIDEENAFEEDSDYDSICELERNVIDSFTERNVIDSFTERNVIDSFTERNVIDRFTERNVLDSFGENTFRPKIESSFSNVDLNMARITEDELMDSFINNFENDKDCDEGLSSVHSDID